MDEPNDREIDDVLPDRLVRFGSAALVAFVVALAATLPGALRACASAHASLFHMWSALGASAAIPALLLVFLLRSARVGARGVSFSPALVLTILFWGVSSHLLLSLFGAKLRATTHHHALAGVTYALVACVVIVLLGALSWRAASLVHRFVGGGWLRVVVLIVSLIAIVVIAGPAVRNVHPYSETLLDSVGLLLFATFGSRSEFERRSLARLGPPLFLLLLVLGVWVLRTSFVTEDALAKAPLFSPFFTLLGGR